MIHLKIHVGKEKHFGIFIGKGDEWVGKTWWNVVLFSIVRESQAHEGLQA